MVCSDSNGYYEGQMWVFVIYLHQYLRNGACYDQILYETHIVSHVWSLS